MEILLLVQVDGVVETLKLKLFELTSTGKQDQFYLSYQAFYLTCLDSMLFIPKMSDEELKLESIQYHSHYSRFNCIISLQNAIQKRSYQYAIWPHSVVTIIFIAQLPPPRAKIN